MIYSQWYTLTGSSWGQHKGTVVLVRPRKGDNPLVVYPDTFRGCVIDIPGASPISLYEDADWTGTPLNGDLR